MSDSSIDYATVLAPMPNLDEYYQLILEGQLRAMLHKFGADHLHSEIDRLNEEMPNV